MEARSASFLPLLSSPPQPSGTWLAALLWWLLSFLSSSFIFQPYFCFPPSMLPCVSDAQIDSGTGARSGVRVFPYQWHAWDSSSSLQQTFTWHQRDTKDRRTKLFSFNYMRLLSCCLVWLSSFCCYGEVLSFEQCHMQVKTLAHRWFG